MAGKTKHGATPVPVPAPLFCAVSTAVIALFHRCYRGTAKGHSTP
jgi:hypothetical protein